MIKLLSLIKRQYGMPIDEFQKHWLEVHAPLVARTPGLRRYAVTYADPETYTSDHPPAYDGVAEAWFDNTEALEAARHIPEWEGARLAEPGFIQTVQEIVVREREVVGVIPIPAEPPGGGKRFVFMRKKEGIDVEAFQAYWHDIHAAVAVPEHPELRIYVQSHPLPETYNSPNRPPYDAISEIWLHETIKWQARDEAAPPSPAEVDYYRVFNPVFRPHMIGKHYVIKE